MAINPSELQEFSGRITPASPDFPYGSARNDSTGTAGDGTPITKPILDDIFGLQQYFLSKEGITPSGTADNAQLSQVAQAMLRAMSRNVYSPDINYPVHARVIDDNGVEKRAIQPNGPNLPSGAVDTGNILFWVDTVAERMLGINQSWQIVTSSRAEGFVYTNTTNKPIIVSIYLTYPNSSGNIRVNVDNVAASLLSTNTSDTLMSIVPPGSTYQLSSIGPVIIHQWSELR